MALKDEICRLYPNYLNNTLVFEEKWSKCAESMSSLQENTEQESKKETITMTTGHVEKYGV